MFELVIFPLKLLERVENGIVLQLQLIKFVDEISLFHIDRGNSGLFLFNFFSELAYLLIQEGNLLLKDLDGQGLVILGLEVFVYLLLTFQLLL